MPKVSLCGRHLYAEQVPLAAFLPGHPRHGRVIYRTRRLDLEVADARGRVFVRDHKFKAKVNRLRFYLQHSESKEIECVTMKRFGYAPIASGWH